MKKTIRLTESELRNIVNRSVKKVLREWEDDEYTAKYFYGDNAQPDSEYEDDYFYGSDDDDSGDDEEYN